MIAGSNFQFDDVWRAKSEVLKDEIAAFWLTEGALPSREAADKRIARVLWNDPATGVMRHADAGYQEAIDCAREQGLNLPMIDTGRAP